MTQFQKVVKYCAIALAIFLIVSIIGGIVGAVASIAGLSGNSSTVGENRKYDVESTISHLKIDIAAAALEIREGEIFCVETNLKNLTVVEKDGKLIIEEKSKLVSASYNDAVLTVTIPAGHSFRDVDISTGAGKVAMGTLCAETLALELGAGEVTIQNLTATKEAEIDGGAGKLTIGGGALSDLELDMGVGEMKLTSLLSGSCELNMGVGKAELNLIGSKEDYAITLDKGIGNITVDGASFDSGSKHGSGETKIDIDGGVGAINIDYITQ